MKITTKVSGDIPIMVIGYTLNPGKVIQFISTEGNVSNTDLGYPYLTHLPYIYLNVSIFPVVYPRILESYFNPSNYKEQHKNM